MAVRTALLHLPTTLTPVGGAVYYTTPASTTTIVKGLSIVNATAGAVTIDGAIRRSGANRYFMWKRSQPANSSEWLDRWIVLEPGDQLWWVPSVNNALVVGAYGTELAGVAP